MKDAHGQDNCPCCTYALLDDGEGVCFCTNCGWVLPSPWVLFRLLRKARNWVQDDVLRAEILKIAPPEPRPIEVLEQSKSLPQVTCSCVGGCLLVKPMGYSDDHFKKLGGGQLPPDTVCKLGFTSARESKS